MDAYADAKRKEKEEEILAKRVARAREKEERELKKAAGRGRPGKRTKTEARFSDAIRQLAKDACLNIPKIEQAPKHDYTNFINNRQSAYDNGEDSYCVFGDGAKHVTRQFSYAHKEKSKTKGGGVSVEIIPYSQEHNDREFESDNALHIDPEREPENLYWNCYDGYYRRPTPYDRKTTKPTKDRETDTWLEKYGVTDTKEKPLRFKDAELRFVHEHFAAAIDHQNAKHRRAGNTDRILDTDDPAMWKEWLKTHPPQELLLQIGSRDDSVTPDILEKITPDLLNKLKEQYNFVAVNFAIHCDEDGAPHVHVRGYYIGLDENGLEIASRNAALTQRSVAPSLGRKFEKDLINADKNPDDYRGTHYRNNTCTFTDEVSEILFQLAEKHGVKVARTPYQTGGLSRKDYIARAKASPRDAKIALQKLELPLSIQERRQCILTILEGVDKGLSYYPTAWTSKDAATQAEREMRPALKKAREITEQLPEILRKQNLESPDAELEKLQERIKRTHRALGRAKNRAGSKDAKNDDGNQKKHAERVEWLRRLQRMHELLLRYDMPSYGEEHAARLAAEAKLNEAEDKLKARDARVRELEAKLAARDDEAATKAPAPATPPEPPALPQAPEPTLPPIHQQHPATDLRSKLQQQPQAPATPPAPVTRAAADAATLAEHIVLPPACIKLPKSTRDAAFDFITDEREELARRLGVPPKDMLLYDLVQAASDAPAPAPEEEDNMPTAAWFEQRQSQQPQQPQQEQQPTTRYKP